MDEFMENIVLYGLLLGLLLLAIFIIIFIIKMKNGEDESKTTFHLLPFLGGTSLFASTGLSVVIESIYYGIKDTEKLISGVVFSIPLFIVIFIYILNYIKEIKIVKIEEQEKKYREWK